MDFHFSVWQREREREREREQEHNIQQKSYTKDMTKLINGRANLPMGRQKYQYQHDNFPVPVAERTSGNPPSAGHFPTYYTFLHNVFFLDFYEG